MAGDSRSSRVGFSALPPAPAWPTLHPGFVQPRSPPRSAHRVPPTSPPGLEAPPTSPAPPPPRPEAPPPHRPPSPCGVHLRFHSGQPRGPKGNRWQTTPSGSWRAPWAGAPEQTRDRGGRRRSLALPLPGGAWHPPNLNPSSVCAKLCQA